MKFKSRIWALLAILGLGVMSCTPTPDGGETPDEVEPWVMASNDVLSFECDAIDPQTIEILSHDLAAVTVQAADEWCTVTTEVGAEAVLATISVEKNTGKARSTELTLTSGEALGFVTVNQLGFEPELLVSTTKEEVEAKGGEFKVTVTTNLDEIEVTTDADWITYTVEENKYTFTVAENTAEEARKATIKFEGPNYLSKTVEVSQAAAEKEPVVEQPDRVDTGDDKFVAYASAATETSHGSYPIENINDGNLLNWWQTPTVGVDSPATVTFTFDGLPRVERMVYYPNAEYGQWGEIEIAYYTTETKREQTLGSFDLGMKSEPQIVDFGKVLSDVQSIIVKVKTAKGRSSTKGVLAAACEVEFFRTNNYLFATDIFTDCSCAEFREDFDIKDIDKIEDETLKYIVGKVSAEGYDPAFRVDYAEPYPHPDVDARRFNTNTYTLCDNVTGIVFVEPGTYTICLGPTKGFGVRMKVVNWQDKESGDHIERDYVLREGVNKVELRDGGHAYLMYHTEAASAEPIRYNFVDGEVNGYFDPTKHDASEFADLLYKSRLIRNQTKFSTSFDMVGAKSIVTVPSNVMFKQGITGKRAISTLATFDEIVSLEEEFQGHVKYNTGGHRNRAWFSNRYSSFMWAGSYVMGFNTTIESVAALMCNGETLKKNVWGPAHELGHCNQIRIGLKWVGMTEVSNNFMSCYVDNYYTGATALKKGGKYFHAHRDIGCKQGTNHIMACGYDTPYLKLVPFWQLHLYYHDVMGMDFFPDIQHTIRNYSDCATMKDQEAMLRFCELASSYTGEDLTEFFEYWKMLIPVDAWINDYGSKNMVVEEARVNAAREKMSKEKKPARDIRWINEDNKDLYKNNPEVVAGTFEVLEDGYSIRMSGWKNAVAYLVVDEEGVIRQHADQGYTQGIFRVVSNECRWYYTKKNSDGSETKVYSPDNTNSKTYNEQEYVREVPYFIDQPRVYGVRADGTWVPALNNPF